MRRLPLIALTAAFALSPAFAAEPEASPGKAAATNQDCRAFLSGAWLIEGGAAVTEARTATYNPDGTYEEGVEAVAGGPDKPKAANGSWDAKAGEGDKACDLMVTPSAQPMQTIALTIQDQNVVKDDKGNMWTRKSEPETVTPAAN